MKFFPFLPATVILTSLIVGSVTAAEQDQKSMKDTTPPVTVPVVLGSPKYSFEVSFTALIMKPFANNLDYAAEALPFDYGDAQPAISPNWVIPEISPDFHFGFDVGIAGFFHGADSTLMLNWERYHSPTDSDSLTVAIVEDMVGPFFEIGPDASPYKYAKGTTKFHFDEVNLDYGTLVNFGDRLHANLFAGVTFGRISQYRFTTFSNLAGDLIRTLNVPAKFVGAGPQLGFDFTYKIVKGFQFVGNMRTSLFIGTFKNSTTFTTTSNDLVTLGDTNPNVQTTTVTNKKGIVPGLEGKLGLAYEFLFCRHYMIKLEAGYQAKVYINSIRSTDMGSEVALGTIGSIGSATTGVYARSFERVVSDFGLAGPYVTLDLAF